MTCPFRRNHPRRRIASKSRGYIRAAVCIALDILKARTRRLQGHFFMERHINAQENNIKAISACDATARGGKTHDPTHWSVINIGKYGGCGLKTRHRPISEGFNALTVL